MGGGPARDHLLCALPGPEPEGIIERLRKKFPKIEITYHNISESFDFVKVRKELPADIWDDISIIFTFNALPEKPSDSPKLQLLQLMSAGSNHIQNHPIYTDTDVTIATASGIHGPQIAEWVIMTGLVQSHHYNLLHDFQKKHEWGKKGPGDAHLQVRDWVGQRIGILGYGSIGRQVGKVAKAMGMDVVAYTAGPKDTPEKKKDTGFIVPGTGDPDGEIPSAWYSGLGKESLHNFLKQDLDWILVAVPLTDQTRHFLSTEEFKILSQGGKKKPYSSNIARGPIIDQPALIKALKDGTLGGAALDVTDPEPLPEDSELWDLKNAIVTPHVSGNGVSYTERAFQVLETNLERRENGEKLINVVNRERGY